MSLSGFDNIVGKRIIGVIAATAEDIPRCQVFLLFDDNTYYEMYSPDAICATKSIDRGGIAEIKRYMHGKLAFEAHVRDSKQPPNGSEGDRRGQQ